MKFLGVKWFTTMQGTIGIVYGEDEVTGDKKAYIDTVPGFDEGTDIHKIQENGAKFPAEIAEQLINT